MKTIYGSSLHTQILPMRSGEGTLMDRAGSVIYPADEWFASNNHLSADAFGDRENLENSSR